MTDPVIELKRLTRYFGKRAVLLGCAAPLTSAWPVRPRNATTGSVDPHCPLIKHSCPMSAHSFRILSASNSLSKSS